MLVLLDREPCCILVPVVVVMMGYGVLASWQRALVGVLKREIETLPSTLALASCSNTSSTTGPDYFPTSTVSPLCLITSKKHCNVTSNFAMQLKNVSCTSTNLVPIASEFEFNISGPVLLQ